MAAVMLDQEQPHQKGPGQNTQHSGQEVADRDRPPGQHPQDDKRAESDGKFEQAAGQDRLPVCCEHPHPVAGGHVE
jgi:hypothetical protein